MAPTPRLVLTLALGSFLAWPALAADTTADTTPPRAACVPAGAVLVAEVSRPEAVLDLLFSSQVQNAVTSSPQFKQLAEGDKLKELQQGVKTIEGLLNADWQTAIRRLTAGGLTLAVTPTGGSLIVLDAQDEPTLRQARDLLLMIAKGQGDKDKGASTPTWKRYNGQVQWTLGKDNHLVIAGKRAFLSNQETALRAALDLNAGKGKSVTGQPAYQSAREALGQDACGTVFIDLAALKKAPNAKDALVQLTDPWATLFFGSLIEAVKESNWAGLKLRVDKDRLALEAVADKASPSPLFAFTHPRDKEGALPLLTVPRQIASASLYRDLKGFYTAKDQLFPDRGSALIFFENMMAIFFSGRQLTDEVFAEFHPEYRIVVAAQEFDAKAAPEVKLPGFALVIRLRRPAEFKETAEEAWQKAVGLVGFSIGQKGQSGMIMDRDIHEGIKYQVARFTAPRSGDKTKLPTQYNFRPSLVLMDDWFVFSSTEALAKDLIVALKKEKAAPAAGVNTLAVLDGKQLAAVLQTNRTNLVLNNMTEKGSSKEQAESEIDLLLTLVQVLGQAQAGIGVQSGRPHATLSLQLNLP